MMLRRLGVAVALTAIISGCAPAVDGGEEEGAVRQISSRWLELTRAQDAAGIADLFAEDGAVYWEDRPSALGKSAIQEFMALDFADNPDVDGTFGPDRIDVAASGDLAVEHGEFRSPQSEGRYLTVYRKIGGEWKVQADMSVSTSPDGGAPSWARESLASWYDRFNARDAEGLADLYTPDARVGNARGRDEIIQRFQAEWAESDYNCSGSYDDFVVIGSLAAGWGHDTCVGTPAAGGPSETMRSRWLALYERQSDGSWLCARDQGEGTGS